MKVHRQALLAAIGAGAHTLSALQARTRAGTGCGTCRIDLLQLLAAAGHGPSEPAVPSTTEPPAVRTNPASDPERA